MVHVTKAYTQMEFTAFLYYFCSIIVVTFDASFTELNCNKLTNLSYALYSDTKLRL